MPHNPSAHLLLAFLTWVAERPRTYGEAMDAWRTSCPRLSVWEDALDDALIRIDATDALTQDAAKIMLTPPGHARLATGMAAPEYVA